MTSPSYTRFKSASGYADAQLLTQVENNLKYWLDWALLSIGGWTDVYTIDSVSINNGLPCQLRPSIDLSYTNGKVWQGVKKDWVWEQEVDYQGSLNPINITGVIINNVGTTGYRINYPLGQVILNTAIATGSTVKASYSYRNVQVYCADKAPWWRELQFSTTADNTQFTRDPSTGDWSIGGHHRIQLPTIIIEAVPRGVTRPYEIGNGSLWVEQDVVFHILAEDRITRNNLVSMLFLENDHIIYLFNTNDIAKSGAFPLDYRGNRVNSVIYPDLVSETGYRWKKCRFTRTTMSEIGALNPLLYEGVVRTTLELVLDDI